MLSSRSSDALGTTWERLLAAQARGAAEGLSRCVQKGPDAEAMRAVSRDFASVLYSTLWQQMQRTVGRDEEGEEDESFKEGVQDFVGMFLPRAVAGHSQDPLSRYIYEHLGKLRGELPHGQP